MDLLKKLLDSNYELVVGKIILKFIEARLILSGLFFFKSKIPGKAYFRPEGLSSALGAFTSLFGMERGGTHPTKSPGNFFKF